MNKFFANTFFDIDFNVAIFVKSINVNKHKYSFEKINLFRSVVKWPQKK